MFDNIGRKIKTFAKIVCWVGIILCIMSGIYLIKEDFYEWGLLIILVGSFCSWVASFGLYGFGELIEDVHRIAEKIDPDTTDIETKTKNKNQQFASGLIKPEKEKESDSSPLDR